MHHGHAALFGGRAGTFLGIKMVLPGLASKDLAVLGDL